MKKNVGSTDKIIRMVLAIAIGYFAYSTTFEINWIQYVLYVIAAIMLVTPITGYCPLYTLFGINTCEIKE
jgi:hypothetical protein